MTLANTGQGAHRGVDRILVVDDMIGMRLFITNVVANLGYEVDGVETAQLALQRLESVTYDFVITELDLPGMDGVALIDAVADLPPPRRPRIIVCSARGTKDQLGPALPKVDTVLRKPVSSADIATALFNAVSDS